MPPARLTIVTQQTAILDEIIRHCHPSRLNKHFHSLRRNAEVYGTTVSLVAAKRAVLVQDIGVDVVRDVLLGHA
jgi:hypothetical protein